MKIDRRGFVAQTSMLGAWAAVGAGAAAAQSAAPKFKISLAQWSLHRAIQTRLITNLDFPRVAREHFGIEGLEFVNQLWDVPVARYIDQLKKNINDSGTQAVLIMCDGEGMLGHSEKRERDKAVANHFKWAEYAAELGCHSIRVNIYTDEQDPLVENFVNRCAESLNALGEYAGQANLNVIVENHGGLSSDPDVVVRIMKQANRSNVGTLPDFGNFPAHIDRYQAVEKMMPYAKAVSMKCYDFGPDGKETTIDMERMMNLVAAAGYNGWVGIEYEGRRLTEFEGVHAARKLLEKLQ